MSPRASRPSPTCSSWFSPCFGQPLAWGGTLRRGLARHGVRRSAPAFYQMMARLEDAGLVDGDYDQKVIDSQIIKERRYSLTRAGEMSWKSTRDFYVESIPDLTHVIARQRRKGPARA